MLSLKLNPAALVRRVYGFRDLISFYLFILIQPFGHGMYVYVRVCVDVCMYMCVCVRVYMCVCGRACVYFSTKLKEFFLISKQVRQRFIKRGLSTRWRPFLIRISIRIYDINVMTYFFPFIYRRRFGALLCITVRVHNTIM